MASVVFLFLRTYWKPVAGVIAIFALVVSVRAWDQSRLNKAFLAGQAACEAVHREKAVLAASDAQKKFNQAIQLREEADNESQRQSRIARDRIATDSEQRLNRLRDAIKARDQHSASTAKVGLGAEAARSGDQNDQAGRGSDANSRADSDSRLAQERSRFDQLLGQVFQMRQVALECGAESGVLAQQLEVIENATSSR